MPKQPPSTTHNMAWEVPDVDINKAQVVLRLTGGAEGPAGPPTASIVIKGIARVYPPADATASKTGDLWIVPDPVPAGFPKWVQSGHGLFWDGHNWLDAGKLKGTKGDQGPVGPGLVIKGVALGWVPSSSPNNGDIWLIPDTGLTGLPADIVPGQGAGWDATAKKWVPVNIVGPAGHSVEVFGPTKTGSMPPTVRSDGDPVAKGDIWLTEDPNVFSATFDPSKMTMIPGPPGPVGPVGQSAYEAWKLANSKPAASLADFAAAIKGAKGEKGDKGDAGETLKISGVVADEASLPATPPNLTVIMLSTGELFIYDPTSAAAKPSGWVDLGKIAGPAGRAAHATAAVSDVSKLPVAGTPGEMTLVQDTGHFWMWDDATSAWVDGGKIASSTLADGTAQGQLLVWDDTAKAWVPANARHLTFLGAQATVPAGEDGDCFYLNADIAADPVAGTPAYSSGFYQHISGTWVLIKTSTFLGAQITLPATADIGDLVFLTTPDGVSPPGFYRRDAVGWNLIKFADTLDSLTNVAAATQADGTALENADILHYSLADTTWKAISIRDFMQAQVELANISDVTVTGGATPTDGQVLTWDATGLVWTNKDPTGASPIVYLGTGTWDNTAALDGTDPLYGMPAGTTPSVADYPPIPGDSYIDLATGHVTTFTGTVTTRRTGGAITGGGGTLDIIRERLQDLDDVSNVAPTTNQILVYNGGANEWVPTTPSYATTSYVNTRVEALATGLAHDVAVADIRNDPPDGPTNANIYYIVGTAPTGVWAGHANAIAYYTRGAGGLDEWHFETPKDGEAHLVEDEAATYSWSTARATWVKIAAAQTGANVNAASLYQVGDIKQSILNETQFRTMLGAAEADKWALADGRNVASSDYHTLTGNTNVPDLRGSFLRMAGQNATHLTWNGGPLGAYQEDNTAHPKSRFTGTANANGSHHHDYTSGWGSKSGIRSSDWGPGQIGWTAVKSPTESGGLHSHSVSITGGGDAETRPKNYGVNFFIKVKA